MLPNGNFVRDALLGGNAIAAAAADALVIDTSSSAPLQTRELGRELQKSGVGLIDAPVSGGVRRAVDGSLAIMAGSRPPPSCRATSTPMPRAFSAPLISGTRLRNRWGRRPITPRRQNLAQ
jgi:3-hydroxyisobutyrate dehydrogenase-like beta-hydroxyacid dehydrogenase